MGDGQLELGQAALDAAPFRLGGVQGVCLAGVSGARLFGVVAAAGEHALALGAVGVVPEGLHAGVGGDVSVLVAVAARQGDAGHGQAAGGLRFAGQGEQQAPALDGGDGIEAFAESGQEVQVGLVGLVDVLDPRVG